MEKLAFEELVARYLRGRLNENEYDILIENIQNQEFREYFEHSKVQWENNPELDDLATRNLSRLLFKIDQTENQNLSNRPIRKLLSRVASVAAILILGLLAGSIVTYYLSVTNKKSEQLVFETPRGEKSMVKLPDGSEVWLNANSRLVYNSFSSKHRQVELKGEAFFKVTHNEKVPFIVKTDECDIKVLGTTFNVMAYDEFGRKEITLLEGKVDVQAGEKERILKPGQSLVLKDHQMQIAEVNASQASAWVDNKFNFKDIPLSELIQRLENWYDVDITLENPNGREVNYTGTFKNEETIWQVLDAIKVYTSIEYEKSDTRKINIKVK